MVALNGSVRRTLLSMSFLVVAALPLWAQDGPLVYVLGQSDRVAIILGDTPREVAAFDVYRRGPNDSEFLRLTPEPIRRVGSAFEAIELMGGDFAWLAKKLDTDDPATFWRRILADRSTALLYSLISPGLRMALGRTAIDVSVEPGTTYRYRIELLDGVGQRVEVVTKRVTVGSAEPPPAPEDLEVDAGDGTVELTWDYPRYRGRDDDLAVGFHLFRTDSAGNELRITRAPVLRIEGILSFIDQDAKNGEAYRYSVAAVDMVGTLSSRVSAPAVTPVDASAPLVPMGLVVADTYEGVLVSWRISPELDIDHYNLYRGEDLEGEFARINPEPIAAALPRYVDGSATPGRAWYYQVTAVDTSGNESGMAGPVTIIPIDEVAPAAVTGLAAELTGQDRYVELTWDPVDAADLAGYHIYRGEDETSLVRLTGTPQEPSSSPEFIDQGYRERGLRGGQAFVYAVSAMDHSKNESDRAVIRLEIPDTEPPPAPFSLSARTTPEGAVDLLWQPALSADLAGHRVYRKDGREFALVVELPRADVQYRDETVDRGVAYEYRVTEVDDWGNESEPSRTVRVVPTDIVPPEPPSEGGARVTGRGVTVTWAASPAEDVAEYILYRAAYDGAPWRRVTTLRVDRTEHLDRGGRPGNVYALAAVDSSGNVGERRSFAVEEDEDG
jgi:fibronectin type 3 domain-containing protein